MRRAGYEKGSHGASSLRSCYHLSHVFLTPRLPACRRSFHPEYRPELNGKERYAVYHMALSRKVLRERLGEEVAPEGEYSLEGYELLD